MVPLDSPVVDDACPDQRVLSDFHSGRLAESSWSSSPTMSRRAPNALTRWPNSSGRRAGGIDACLRHKLKLADMTDWAAEAGLTGVCSARTDAVGRPSVGAVSRRQNDVGDDVGAIHTGEHPGVGRHGGGVPGRACPPESARRLKTVRDLHDAGPVRLPFRAEGAALARLRHANTSNSSTSTNTTVARTSRWNWSRGKRWPGGWWPAPASSRGGRVGPYTLGCRCYAQPQNVLHRDLKQSNVLIANDGTPKISDFGLAKELDDGAAG